MTTQTTDILRFSKMENNAKLKNLRPHLWERGYFGQHLIYNNPAGHSCMQAKACRAAADKVTGKIIHGPHQEFVCYAAALESFRPQLRHMLHENLRLLKEAGDYYDMSILIEVSLKMAGAWDNGSVVRIHSHGDFFTPDYLRAWALVASVTPANHYYAYTKAISWAAYYDNHNMIPGNLSITASRGGTEDHLIADSGFKEAIVVGSEEEAHDLGLEIDKDDSHACFGSESFALVIHGTGNQKLVGTRMQPSIRLEVVA
jgi:hypothetical protein